MAPRVMVVTHSCSVPLREIWPTGWMSSVNRPWADGGDVTARSRMTSRPRTPPKSRPTSPPPIAPAVRVRANDSAAPSISRLRVRSPINDMTGSRSDQTPQIGPRMPVRVRRVSELAGRRCPPPAGLAMTGEENTHLCGQVVFVDGGSDAVLRGASTW